MEGKVAHAQTKMVRERAGVGCIIQGLGMIAPILCALLFGQFGYAAFGLFIGLVALPVLAVIGTMKSKKYFCGNCEKPLANKKVKECPACQAVLGDG